MTTPLSFEPAVNPASEFLEISADFTDPKEVIREAASNAFDAGAAEFRVTVVVDKSLGIDELVLKFEDNGHGMDIVALNSFFGLGFSTRRTRDSLGKKVSGAIGEKGHGTKTYFNSRRIEVSTVSHGTQLDAFMDAPKQTLRQGKLPAVTVTETTTERAAGTIVRVYGYNENSQTGFSHAAIRDYLYWFTKFGSFEREVGIKTHETFVLVLRGLGRNEEPERLSFGHRFPAINDNLAALKKVDLVAPLEHYVARWVFPDVAVQGMADSKIDIVFYLEGDKAKRDYNKMIHTPYTTRNEGEYNVEARYGLWLCKDFIPICRRNNWVSERSEWTKYHAFVNSQDFRLTANRSNLDNTPVGTLNCIESTVRETFQHKIAATPQYKKFLEEMERQQQYTDAKAEEKDFARRKSAALSRKTAEYKGFTLVEPRQEGGVFSIVMVLLAMNPDLFNFKVVDYDTNFGYDLLVTKDTALDLNRASLRFVEMKYELKRDFNHSFDKLWSVICWDTKLANEETVSDLAGVKRVLKVTAPVAGEDDAYTKYMLTSDTATHNIEVFVLKEFLKERLDLDFKVQAKAP